MWEILREAGIDPAPDRSATTWAAFLRSQAQALLAADFIETITATGTRLNVLAVIEHATRRIRILGATAHPTAAWVTQTARNLVKDLQDAESTTRYLIRDRDGKYPALFDAILADSGITVVRSGVQMPRMNAIMERWVRTCAPNCSTEPCNQRHLIRALREYEDFYNAHRPHQGIANTRPLAPLPEPIGNQDELSHASAAATASAGSHTSTNMPLDQPGRNSRQVQGRRGCRCVQLSTVQCTPLLPFRSPITGAATTARS